MKLLSLTHFHGVIAAALLALFWSGCSGQKAPVSVQEASSVLRAAESFVRSREAEATRPASFPIASLVEAKLIKEEVGRKFAGTVVDVLQPPDEASPQAITIRLRLPNGKMFGLHADGTVGELVP